MLTPSVSVSVSFATLASFPASTVTVCAVFQPLVPNVRLNVALPATPLAVTALASLALSTLTVTVPPGCVANTTVNVAPVVACSVTLTDVGSTVTPAVSSSRVVTCVPVCVASPVYASPATPSGSRWTAYVWSPSSRSSSTPVTVTVCAVFQLPVPNVRLAGAAVPSPVS